MKTKYLLTTTCLILLLFWPSQAQETFPSAIENGSARALSPARLSTVSETNYLNELALRGYKIETQGLLIEALDSSAIYADINSTVGFNPASVIKLATSFTALNKFGADYRFETAFYIDGTVNKKTRTLTGNLILGATGDPIMTNADVTRLARQVVRAGIAKVTGSLIISGPFTYGMQFTTDKAVKGLNATLKRVGIRVAGGTKPGKVHGTQVATRLSSSLRDILFYQNAHSSNPVAERLGEAVGGPKMVEQFLIRELKIPPGDIQISHTSGLDFNRITPHATVQLLRELVFWLNLQGMQPQDIMPVAGIDPGTLHTRFTSLEYRGGIIAKTGTLPGTDGGVSTLAGILYTKNRGPVLFAIFNTNRAVRTSRRLQDHLLEDFIAECGGIPEVSVSLHRSNN